MKWLPLLLAILLWGCETHSGKGQTTAPSETKGVSNTPFLVVLGTLQDAGSPHIACKKSCCRALFDAPDPLRQVVSLGLIDPGSQGQYLFEATPDMATQTKKLKTLAPFGKELPDGIFLTHAHIGHYSGLMFLGKEATNAQNAKVFAMPRMKNYLETNGPWDQLVRTGNIAISELLDGETVPLSDDISVTPFLVPHRDEYSETVGYTIAGPSKKAMFIPDIDKWEKWETPIIEAISKVDYAFLDATFFHGEEINTRDISQIPHPFVVESMALFEALPPEERKKIHFIHFNHTNPLLNPESEAYKMVLEKGFQIARMHSTFPL